MTSNDTWQTNDSLVPKDNPEIAAIMAERGIGRRRAYALSKRMSAEAIDTTEVTTSQKVLVLQTLIAHPEVRNSLALLDMMHKEGSRIDGHDVIKMLWACQKSRWVAFRERKSGSGKKRGLYAIKVRDEGHAAALPEAAADKYFESGLTLDAERAVEARASAELSEAEVVETVKPSLVEQAKTIFTEAPGAKDLSLDDYPHIVLLMHDYKRQEKLAAASRLLEEAGEDDMAIQVMERTSISDLDRDVVRLVHAVFGEVYE